MKTLRQILCVLNAILTISVVIQVVELITKLALKTRVKKKPAMKQGSFKKPYSSTSGQSALAISQVDPGLDQLSLIFLGGDIIILSITVIVGWIGIITLKRRILYVYSVLIVIDVLYTILLIIRDASSDSWLIMFDTAVNIMICITMYFLFRELSKCHEDAPGNNRNGNGNANGSVHRINSMVDGYPNGSIIPSPTSAASALGNTLDPIDELGDVSDSALQSYLETRRATIWSNGSLICETTLPPSTYWETSLCISVAPSPYTINCDPPPPWSPPEDLSLSASLGLNVSPDDNNNDRHNNLNLNGGQAFLYHNNNLHNNHLHHHNPHQQQPQQQQASNNSSSNARQVNGHIEQGSHRSDQLSLGESTSTLDSEDTITELPNV